MNIKSHPEYWNYHKRIWQKEYDNLNSNDRDVIMNDPFSAASKKFNEQVDKQVERELLSWEQFVRAPI